MADCSNPGLKVGPWVDETKNFFNGHYYLLSNYSALFLTSAVAAAITIAAPYFLILLGRFVLYIISCFDAAKAEQIDPALAGPSHVIPASGQNGHPNEQTRLLGRSQDRSASLDQHSAGDVRVRRPMTASNLDSAASRDVDDVQINSDRFDQVERSDSQDRASSPGSAHSNAQSSETNANRHASLRCIRNASGTHHVDPNPTAQVTLSTDAPAFGTSSPDPANSNPLVDNTDGLNGSIQASRMHGHAHITNSTQYHTVQMAPLPTNTHLSKPASTFWANIAKPLLLYSMGRGPEIQSKTLSSFIFLVTILFPALVALFVAGVFSNRIASQSAALSDSTICGLYQLDKNLSDSDQLKDFQRSFRKEERAGQYARNCYDRDDPANDVSCKLFWQEKIETQRRDGQRCPFKSLDMCVEPYGASAFWTDLIPAKALGINSNKGFKFRRKSVCAPVSMNPYIEPDNNSSDPSRYLYFYGNKTSDEYSAPYTYDSQSDPWNAEAPHYTLDVYFYNKLAKHNWWMPIEDLMPAADDSSLTMMFILSHNLYHYKQNYDLIFPADEPRPEYKGQFYNSDPRARPLACVDTIELCIDNEDNCWPINASEEDLPKDGAFWLMALALRNSNTYEALKHRLGTALLANENIGGYFTSGFMDGQWITESYNLFKVSLARVQWDLWTIATGEDACVPGYLDYTPDVAKNKLCDQFKFKMPGYTNVNSVAFWGIIIAAFVIWILTWETWYYTSCPLGRNDGQIHGEALCRFLIIELFPGAWWIVWTKIPEWWRKAKDHHQRKRGRRSLPNGVDAEAGDNVGSARQAAASNGEGTSAPNASDQNAP